MNILVVGGAGYIGSHMVWECVDRGEDVVVIDNLVTGFEWALAPGITFIRGDVGDQQLVEHVPREHRIDTIVHFAGSVVVPESLEKPLKYYDNNTGKTRALLASAVRCGVDKFIFSSTAAVYAPPSDLTPVDETAPLAPSAPYGQSKLMSEIMVRDTALAHGMRYVMLRYFNVAGADPKGRTGLSTKGATHVMKLACEAATGKRPYFEVYGTNYDTPDGSAMRDFIHVSDLANAHYVAMQFLRQGGRKFTGNAGYSQGYSVLRVIEAVQEVAGKKFEVRSGPRREGDIPAIVADASRMMKRLDWRGQYQDLHTIIEHALAWEEKLSARQQADAPSMSTPAQSSPTVSDGLTNRATLV